VGASSKLQALQSKMLNTRYFFKVESERLDCGAKCMEQINWTIWRDSERAGYQKKNYFRIIAEYRRFSSMI